MTREHLRSWPYPSRKAFFIVFALDVDSAHGIPDDSYSVVLAYDREAARVKATEVYGPKFGVVYNEFEFANVRERYNLHLHQRLE